jgi:hypothetical protein
LENNGKGELKTLQPDSPCKVREKKLVVAKDEADADMSAMSVCGPKLVLFSRASWWP